MGVGIHGEPGRRRVALAPADAHRGGAGRRHPARPRRHGRAGPAAVRQRLRRHPGGGALSRLPCRRPTPGAASASASPGRWSAATSPRSTWPAARSPCRGSTTSSPSFGMPRSAPQRCVGMPDDRYPRLPRSAPPGRACRHCLADWLRVIWTCECKWLIWLSSPPEPKSKSPSNWLSCWGFWIGSLVAGTRKPSTLM